MEFVALAPILVLAGLICVQALLLGLTAIYAQAAAGTAARQPQGAGPGNAALPVPAPWRTRATTRVEDGRAEVTLRSPAVVPGMADRHLQVRAEVEL